MINSYIKAVKNGSADADKIAADVAQVLEQGHITKFPNELIKSYIKEVQSNNPNEAKLETFRDYMTTAYQVSENALVEYDLIDNAENGIETMMNQTFDNYKLNTADGREVSLNSDEGVMFLVDQLANPANDSTALQVFFAHTGLGEKAVDLISKSVDLDAIPAACEQLGLQLTEALTDVKALDGKFGEFAESKSVAYSSYKDAVQHFVKTMDKEYADKSVQERRIYSVYRSFLNKTQNADFAKNLPAEQIMPMLEKVHSLAVQNVNNSALQGAEQLNVLSQTLVTRLSAMEALKVPADSDSEKTRVEFVQKGNDVYAQLAETIQNINALLA